jgi:hypothetical protein
MRAWIDWLKGTGLASLCVLVVGCGGGGDVPDPGSDSSTAAEGSGGGEAPPAAAPDAAPAGAPGMPPGMRRGMAGAQKGQAAPATEEGAPDDAPPPAAKGAEGGSATAEMLAMATGGQGGAASGGSDGIAPNAQPGTSGPGGPMPGGPGGSGGMMAGRPGGPPPGYPGAGGSGGPRGGSSGMSRPGAPGGAPPASPGVGADMMARMMQQNNQQQQNRQQQNRGPGGGPPGAGGMPGFGLGGAQQDNGPADVHSPDGAARAFLKALKAKDKTRLAEATALRSQEEASTQRIKDLFKTIVEESISDSELDDLAKKLEGFTVAGENAAKSTGKLGIIIHKPTDDGGYMSRVITVRKEKKGWGVMDISKETEFKGMTGRRQRTGSR